jgi:hypothetical protein
MVDGLDRPLDRITKPNADANIDTDWDFHN